MRAHSNALYMLNQRIKTFQMSYQRLLYALFHPHPPWKLPLLKCSLSLTNYRKYVIYMWLIAQMKSLDALIKDM